MRPPPVKRVTAWHGSLYLMFLAPLAEVSGSATETRLFSCTLKFSFWCFDLVPTQMYYCIDEGIHFSCLFYYRSRSP